METKKLVSIVIPVYNAGKYISETLDSVLNQTYSEWECIIIDDDSTDNSKSIVKEYLEKDQRFFYYHQKNSGASAARNNGFEKSKGEYIQYLDADDIIFPEKIQNMLEATLQLKNQMHVLYCNMILGDHNNIYQQLPLRFSLNLGHNIIFDDIYKKCGLSFGLTPVCFFFPRYVIENIVWDTNLGPVEDMDYFLKILENGYQFVFFPETLVIYRNTPASYSKSLSKLYKSNYKVLSFWMVHKNKFFLTFTRRIALLYKKNFFLFLLKKSDQIYHPKFEIKFNLFQYFFVLLIYPYTALLILKELFNIFRKKFKIKPKKI